MSRRWLIRAALILSLAVALLTSVKTNEAAAQACTSSPPTGGFPEPYTGGTFVAYGHGTGVLDAWIGQGYDGLIIQWVYPGFTIYQPANGVTETSGTTTTTHLGPDVPDDPNCPGQLNISPNGPHYGPLTTPTTIYSHALVTFRGTITTRVLDDGSTVTEKHAYKVILNCANIGCDSLSGPSPFPAPPDDPFVPPPPPPPPPPPSDSDGDGIVDGEDDCPDDAGPASTGGCPLPIALVRPDPLEASVPVRVSFDASGSQAFAGADIDRYHWDFDGDLVVDRVTTTPGASHVYAREIRGGIPTLRVRDTRGNWSSTATLQFDTLPFDLEALGDSVAAGHGLDNLIPPVDPFDLDCRRAPTLNYSSKARTLVASDGYPVSDTVRLLACSGATSHTDPNHTRPGPFGQQILDLPAQLSKDRADREVVTVTATANDALWGFRLVAALLLGSWAERPAPIHGTWSDVVTAALARGLPPILDQQLPRSRANLAKALGTLARNGRSNPTGRLILVTGYYGAAGLHEWTRRVAESLTGAPCKGLVHAAMTSAPGALFPALKHRLQDVCDRGAANLVAGRQAVIARLLDRLNSTVRGAVSDAQESIASSGAVQIRYVDISNLFTISPATVQIDLTTPFDPRNECGRRFYGGLYGSKYYKSNEAEGIYCAGLGHPTAYGQKLIGNAVSAKIEAWFDQRVRALRG